MPREAMKNLTESMFYVLLAFSRGPMCGTDAAAFIAAHTKGRVRLGPATLYTILGKFEKEKYIRETLTEGRKRTYCLTDKGRAAYGEELARLCRCVADAEAAERGEENA